MKYVKLENTKKEKTKKKNEKNNGKGNGDDELLNKINSSLLDRGIYQSKDEMGHCKRNFWQRLIL